MAHKILRGIIFNRCGQNFRLLVISIPLTLPEEHGATATSLAICLQFLPVRSLSRSKTASSNLPYICFARFSSSLSFLLLPPRPLKNTFRKIIGSIRLALNRMNRIAEYSVATELIGWPDHIPNDLGTGLRARAKRLRGVSA